MLMKSGIVDLLICPACLPEEVRLSLDVHESDEVDVIGGELRCGQCLTVYPIAGGIAILRPHQPSPVPGTNSKYEEPEVVSSYLWSHYADLWGDSEVTRAYPEWAEQILPGTGFAVDTGCAVGRFTFELNRKFDFAVGIDSSRSLLTQARKLLLERHLNFHLKQEGHVFERRSIELPEHWDTSRIEFIVADAQALPFRSNLFSCVASLNLVDKLPKPLVHLRELFRAAKVTEAQLLFSDPFSWSEAYAKAEDWLGGLDCGTGAGRGLDNVRAILEGQIGAISPPWTIEKGGEVWWKIRNHSNHFELIRSCFIKARR